ncbi:uncharacterized protein LOC130966654 [Arachis stenosperma]|uniref:uncharacterized protein LOC130966654 n=1 Tax=Arachis stenosperma TaxID=217475 RepID=UPI0025AC72EE|nr:uncharacterized protein LOC130966654 [Arachis stenosperma]
MEVDVVDSLLAQNKLLYQQMSLITQQLSGMQCPIANVYSAPLDAPYDISGSSPLELSKSQQSFIQETRASLRNLEIQMDQLSKRTPERPSDNHHRDTVSNSREECQAVQLRSGKIAGSGTKSGEKQVKKETSEKEIAKTECARKGEALEQIPLYAKFIKELLSNKRDCKVIETVVLTKKCSAIIQKNLPEKLQDPGSFLIPCTNGDTTIQKALCDRGASINLMPISFMKMLQIDEVKSTHISLQPADRSDKYPLRVVENLLVKVGPFTFPVDFMILEMEEDKNASIILGRPFLAT